MKCINFLKISILVFVLPFFVFGCVAEDINKVQSEEYKVDYIKRLNRINAIINVDSLNENDFKYKWYSDKVTLPDEKTTVSLYVLNSKIHAYNLIENKNIMLTGEQIVELYSFPDEAIQKDFDEFHNWFLNNGATKYRDYYNGLIKGYNLYKNINNKKFAEKDFAEFTLGEEIELEQWVKENPDFKLAVEDADYNYLLKILGVDSLPEVKSTNDQVITFY